MSDVQHIDLRPRASTDGPLLDRILDSVLLQRMGAVSPVGLEPLLEMQRLSRDATYAALYPRARWWIIQVDGVAAGQLIEDTQPTGIHIVDLSLLPEWQGRGIGKQVLQGAQSRAGEAGLPLSASVAVNNTASLAMCRSVGMTIVRTGDDPEVQVRWSAQA